MVIPLTPIRCLYRAIDLFGKKIGVVCGEKEFTYQQFGERCLKLASALTAHGIEPGDRVAYLSFNNHQLLEGYYGVVMAKAIVMPLNVRLTPMELTGILNHAATRVLIFENDFAPLVRQLKRDCPRIERYITIDSPVPESDLTYDDVLAGGRAGRTDYLSVDENSIAELFYTSGSTGTPKGVTLSHRTLYLHGMAVVSTLPQNIHALELHTIPLFHANGWGRPPTSV